MGSQNFYSAKASAINDELALTLTTEPVYKKYFFNWGGGTAPSADPSPASHHLTASCNLLSECYTNIHIDFILLSFH